MTPNLSDLIESTFFVSYNMNMSPLEVDNLSTYEMREYVKLLSQRKTAEAENDSSIFKSMAALLGLRRKL